MMSEIKSKVNEIRDVYKNIDQLLDTGDLRIQKNNGEDFIDQTNTPLGIRPILENESCYICYCTFPVAGGTVPYHKHEGCIEYFIVTKGALMIDFGKGVTRIVTARACAAVDEGQRHSVKGLEPDTEYIVVSIPKDVGLSKLFDRVREQGGIIDDGDNQS